MSTLGTAKVRPCPGTVTGRIEEAIARIEAQMAAIRQQYHEDSMMQAWQIRAYFQAVEETPLDTES